MGPGRSGAKRRSWSQTLGVGVSCSSHGGTAPVVGYRARLATWSASVSSATTSPRMRRTAYARDGDTVVVAALDRLGRSLAGIMRTVETLRERGVMLRSLREGI